MRPLVQLNGLVAFTRGVVLPPSDRIHRLSKLGRVGIVPSDIAID